MSLLSAVQFFGSIPLFGLFFWIIFVIFVLWCSACLFFDEKSASLVFPAIVILSLIFGLGLDQYPSFDYKYLIGYLVGVILWIPAYWYIDLRRKASKVRKAGGFAKCKNDAYRYSDVIEKDKDNYQLKHPQLDELSSHGIVWPISVPIVLFEDGIRAFVDFLSSIMDRVRNSISKGLDQ